MTDSPALIAVVDDDKCVCRALERLLRSAGFEVVTFSDGATFLTFLDSNPIDGATIDLHMPQMDGIEVLVRLGKRLPVVMITGHETPESERLAMEAGAAAYFRKPVDSQGLVDAITMAITQNRS